MEVLQSNESEPHTHFINPYIEKFESHPLVLERLGQVWSHFEGKESVVDIGCGNGHFLESYLLKRPSHRGLGLDLRYKRLFKTAKKLSTASPQSRVIKMDASEFLTQCPSDFWTELWVQFPDPWPKDRHSKHRMLHLKSFVEIFRILKPGGSFCFRSDARYYYDLLSELNARHRLFSKAVYSETDQFGDLPSTLFRETFKSRGLKIYSIRFTK